MSTQVSHPRVPGPRFVLDEIAVGVGLPFLAGGFWLPVGGGGPLPRPRGAAQSTIAQAYQVLGSRLACAATRGRCRGACPWALTCRRRPDGPIPKHDVLNLFATASLDDEKGQGLSDDDAHARSPSISSSPNTRSRRLSSFRRRTHSRRWMEARADSDAAPPGDAPLAAPPAAAPAPLHASSWRCWTEPQLGAAGQ